MRLENITCSNSDECHSQYKISHPDVVSMVHGQNAHIIHTIDDYDVIKEGDKKSLHLNKKTCLDLADIGILHHWNGITDEERKTHDNKVNSLRTLLKQQ